ncbi:hypothetical protein J4Q44_G00193110 [Coregonus suidteri]|uniref:Uncharacterized protein n=1 Tax=Coregonus suidteri TaxID=861788 RepID=A0AAN8QU34_9TELE
MRHVLALFLVITLCGSLFLIYHAGFHGTTAVAGRSRDGSDAARRSWQTEQQQTTKTPPPHPTVLQGYSSIIDHKL